MQGLCKISNQYNSHYWETNIKNYMIIPIDAVKAFEKLQQYSHDKSSQPIRNAKELPQTDKSAPMKAYG